MLHLSNDKKIAIALISLASGKSNKYIGHMFSVSKSDVANIIQNISTAILKLMPKHIQVPNENSTKNIVKSFEKRWSFPQTTGVLGSVHIPIQKSCLPENASDYVNSVGGFSMILQGIVDASYLFWDINVGWPGSVPESRVFTSSSLWLKGQERTLLPDYPRKLGNVDIPLFILAGSSYPLSHWVMRPFLVESLSEDEKKFNEKFTFAYNACEIAFKRLKARWNCLVNGNICAIEDFPTVISACCILHNICEEQKEIICDDWIIKAETYYKQPIPQLCNTVIGPQAENFRQAIKEHFVSSEGQA
ncbi:uncharacterized protein LOC129233990 [Uloborus diversus]|uniref:uncharacterized protein LOC129233990 n=1 Tax=Uloborus diversus TaxID=327109 RepID=UPI002408F8DD|nr:uncharacterized protein LOC129233990 [Uloborus diversus]